MTPAELTALEELAKAATNGPWYTVDTVWLPPDTCTYVLAGHFDPHLGTMVCDAPMIDSWPAEEEGPDYSQSWGDMAFIAASREAVPALIAEVRRLQGVVGAARAWRATYRHDVDQTVEDTVNHTNALIAAVDTLEPHA